VDPSSTSDCSAARTELSRPRVQGRYCRGIATVPLLNSARRLVRSRRCHVAVDIGRYLPRAFRSLLYTAGFTIEAAAKSRPALAARAASMVVHSRGGSLSKSRTRKDLCPRRAVASAIQTSMTTMRRFDHEACPKRRMATKTKPRFDAGQPRGHVATHTSSRSR